MRHASIAVTRPKGKTKLPHPFHVVGLGVKFWTDLVLACLFNMQQWRTWTIEQGGERIIKELGCKMVEKNT